MKILILAAGKGTRFKFGGVPKIFANFWGIRVIDLLIKQAYQASLESSVLLNEETYDEFCVSYNAKKYLQKKDGKYGTGQAVRSYLEQICNDKDSIEHHEHFQGGLLIIAGDLPLVDSGTFEKFSKAKNAKKINSQDCENIQNDKAIEAKSNIGFEILVGVMKSPQGEESYGRIIENDEGEIVAIAEKRDFAQKTEYVNTGIMYLSAKALSLIFDLKENMHKEIFLTDIVSLAQARGYRIGKVVLEENEALGFNTIVEYENLLQLAQENWKNKAKENGVCFLDAKSIFLSHDSEFQSGCIIEPYCKFGVNVKICANAIVKSFSYLENCVIDGTVGPFVHIKSGQINQNAQIGSFVEVKNSQIDEGSKIKHLAYIGDAEIGKNVNIGAGVVICNYDGQNKHRTKIEDRAFVGANSSLIAPIKIEQDAFLAAGGTYTQDVHANHLSIARAKQISRKRDANQED
jgi:bifunctional UDP-N-acetylglucosamine pyrophosphorylase/glucosamine-1-phosphate N-acetyltransferase